MYSFVFEKLKKCQKRVSEKMSKSVEKNNVNSVKK